MHLGVPNNYYYPKPLLIHKSKTLLISPTPMAASPTPSPLASPPRALTWDADLFSFSSEEGHLYPHTILTPLWCQLWFEYCSWRRYICTVGFHRNSPMYADCSQMRCNRFCAWVDKYLAAHNLPLQWPQKLSGERTFSPWYDDKSGKATTGVGTASE